MSADFDAGWDAAMAAVREVIAADIARQWQAAQPLDKTPAVKMGALLSAHLIKELVCRIPRPEQPAVDRPGYPIRKLADELETLNVTRLENGLDPGRMAWSPADLRAEANRLEGKP